MSRLKPDELTLAALPAEEGDPRTASHLADCAECRAEVAALRRTVATAQRAGAGSGAAEPPPRVWRAIVDELGDELAPPAAPPATVHELTPWARAARPRRWLLAAAAAAAGLLAGLVIGSGVFGERPEETLAQVPLVPLATAWPAVSGSAEVVESRGARQVVVAVEDPAGVPPGEFLEAWLMDAAGERLYSLGALTRGDAPSHFRGTFTLPADLPLEEFDTVDVSAEPLDGDPAHSGASLLRGRAA